jgi:hypothetical protein
MILPTPEQQRVVWDLSGRGWTVLLPDYRWPPSSSVPQPVYVLDKTMVLHMIRIDGIIVRMMEQSEITL